MATPILMPQVGQDLTEGKVIEIHVSLGDMVAKGDIVAVVESEKASFEVEAFASGIVLALLYRPGDLATVLEPLIILGETGEEVSTATVPQDAPDQTALKKATGKTAPTNCNAEHVPGGAIRSSPLARKLAQQAGIDLEKVRGSGPKGSIVKRDIDAIVSSGASGANAGNTDTSPLAPSPKARAPSPRVSLPAAVREDQEQLFTRMRQVISDRLSISKQTIPHFYLRATADVTDLQIRRRAFGEMTGTKISLNDVMIRASALTLLEFPELNAHVGHDRVIIKGNINIGVAVSVEDGLMVPVIADADRLSITETGETMRDLAAAARRGFSKSSVGSTFSISNLGMYGVEVIPIINPPEAAILGVGPITREMRPINNGFHAREIVSLMLSADHRAVDGASGAQFLAGLVSAVENLTFDN